MESSKGSNVWPPSAKADHICSADDYVTLEALPNTIQKAIRFRYLDIIFSSYQ